MFLAQVRTKLTAKSAVASVKISGVFVTVMLLELAYLTSMLLNPTA